MNEETIARFWSKVEKGPGCWLWVAKSCDQDGYGLFKASGKMLRAHRLAFELSRGAPPGKALVCHHCDNVKCVRPDHLFLGTAKDNFHDCLRKGRYSPKGEGNAAAKVTSADADRIRALYALGTFSQEGLGRIFGVHQTAVSAIVRGKTWKAA